MALAAGMQRQVWDIRPADPNTEELARSLKVSPVLAQVLINRNINSLEQARSFLSPKLTKLIEPEKMPGTAGAAARVKQAPAGAYGCKGRILYPASHRRRVRA